MTTLIKETPKLNKEESTSFINKMVMKRTMSLVEKEILEEIKNNNS